MPRPTLQLKSPITTWEVEVASIVKMPQYIEAMTLGLLRQELHRLSRTYRPRIGYPPLGPLTFRYEHDQNDHINRIHAYFTGKDSKLKRFARLRRL